jgi:hypothetical protein
MKYACKRLLVSGVVGVYIIFVLNCFIFADGTNIKNGGLDLKNIQDAPEEIFADS